MHTFEINSLHSVERQRQVARRTWRRTYLVWLGVTLLAAATIWSGIPAPIAFAFWLMVAGGLITIWRPIFAVYFVSFFAIAGDQVTAYWYPFNKNMSSPESLLFIDSHLSASPLEVFLILATLVWLVRVVASRRAITRGLLFGPLATFTGIIFLGVLRAIASGADRNVALWESRTIFYIPIVYLLTTNLFTRKEHYSLLIWFVSAAIMVDSLLSLAYYFSLDGPKRASLEALGEHSASLHADLLFILIISVMLLPRTSGRRRRWLLPMAVPVLFAFFVAHRRAGVVALLLGGIVVAAALFRVRRRFFWFIVPAAAIIFVGYTGIFWNAQGSLGFPAQAIKAVVYPNQVSQRDQSSDIYRQIETLDIVYTIKVAPLTGIGFGQRFYRPYPLPNLSFWVFSDFITHNGILWVWMKVGVVGFVAMLYLFGSAIKAGSRCILRLPPDDYGSMAIAATAFIVMYAMFTYVDIGWDSQSTVIMGLLLAYIGSIERLHGLHSFPTGIPGTADDQ